MKKCLFPLLILIILMMACETDHGIEPLNSAIEGTITFTGAWPTEPAEVRLVTATKFPPTDITDLDIGEKIPTDVNRYDYTYYLQTGTYKMVGIIWRTADNGWDFSSICGVYFTEGDSLLPGEVTINSPEARTRNINISVNRSKAREVTDARIVGNIQFEGAWPDSFSSAMIVAATRNPLTESFTLLDLNIGSIIPKGTVSMDYSIAASPLTYRAVGILFFRENEPLSIDDLYYSQNVGAMIVQDIPVSDNETVQGPDFNIPIGPILSGIKGTITLAGNWPDTAEEVRLITSRTFPPAFEDLVIGNKIPSDASSYTYEFNLRPDMYKLVGVAWRAAGTVWDLTSICGYYVIGTDSLSPTEVIVETNDSYVENVDIYVNRNKAHTNSDTWITGSIQFNGSWPDDVTEARVIATTQFSILPPVLPTLLDIGFSDSITPGQSTFEYQIKAFPGRFLATAVVFFKEGQVLSMEDVIYSTGVGGLSLAPYNVVENTTVAGPDFTIEF